jgi:hypothetical protein
MLRQYGFGILALACAVAGAAALPAPAHAVLVSTSFEGTVTTDNGGTNPFGLTNGDTIFGTAIYDDALVVGGSPNEEIGIDGLAGWDFTITLGSFSFSQGDVTDPTFTSFFFNNGVLDGIVFFIEPIDIGAFTNLQIEDFNGGESLFVEDATTGSPVYLEADWDFTNASDPVPVDQEIPEPASILLFGAGLAGLGFSGLGWFRSGRRSPAVA